MPFFFDVARSVECMLFPLLEFLGASAGGVGEAATGCQLFHGQLR